MSPLPASRCRESRVYVEFRLDCEHELGIIDRGYLPEQTQAPGGDVIVRWHVDDLPGILHHLRELGARINEPVTEREAGFATASVIDPFGNILGLISSPHYLQKLADGVQAP